MTGNRRFRAAILLAAGMAGALQAATCYVATNGTSVSPFNSWQTAATNIHDAVALAGSGDAVLVGDGAYRLTNTLVVAANLSIQSANGPAATTLYRDAAAGSFGLFTVSQSGALVAGFTMTNGYPASGNGSAVNITAGTVSNCVIAKCTTSGAGGNDVDVSGSAVVVDSTITSVRRVRTAWWWFRPAWSGAAGFTATREGHGRTRS